MVHEACERCLKSKIEDGKSYDYIRTLRVHFNKISKAFGLRNINEVSTTELNDWLRSMKGSSARTRNNARKSAITVWNFARKEGMVPDQTTAAEKTSEARENGEEISVMTPEEMIKFLNLARKNEIHQALSFLVIAGFAGVCTAELQKLEWADINLEEGFIEIAKHKAKTASRSIVPITLYA